MRLLIQREKDSESKRKIQGKRSYICKTTRFEHITSKQFHVLIPSVTSQLNQRELCMTNTPTTIIRSVMQRSSLETLGIRRVGTPLSSLASDVGGEFVTGWEGREAGAMWWLTMGEQLTNSTKKHRNGRNCIARVFGENRHLPDRFPT